MLLIKKEEYDLNKLAINIIIFISPKLPLKGLL